MTRPHTFSSLGICATALLMAGCGNDQRTGTFQPVRPKAATGAPPRPTTTAFAPVTSVGGNDPLAGPDQLTAGADGTVTSSENTSSLSDGDQMTAGPKMPTDHSHWLRGGIFNARVTVSLNFIPLGEFRAPIDKDITMKLRRGINTITFDYQPQISSSSAHLDVLESEHNPPIAPLARFDSPQPIVGQSPKPVKMTFTFIAN